MLFGFHSGCGQCHASHRRTEEARGHAAWDCFQANEGSRTKCYVNIQAPVWPQHPIRLNILAYLQPVCCKILGWLIRGNFAAFFLKSFFHHLKGLLLELLALFKSMLQCHIIHRMCWLDRWSEALKGERFWNISSRSLTVDLFFCGLVFFFDTWKSGVEGRNSYMCWNVHSWLLGRVMRVRLLSNKKLMVQNSFGLKPKRHGFLWPRSWIRCWCPRLILS